MEYFGLIAFIFVLTYSGLPSKLKKVEQKVKSLERHLRGGNSMSKLMNDLKGHHCLLASEEALQWVGKSEVDCEIMDVDEEWVKIRFSDRKGTLKTKIIRIENIKNVELID